MYRVNPLTYLVDGLLSTALGDAKVQCASNEYLEFESPSNLTCGEYMQPYIDATSGYLLDRNASSSNGEICKFCPMSSTNDFLTNISSSIENRWRNFGLMWVYVVFNVTAAVALYWAFRVPKKRKN